MKKCNQLWYDRKFRVKSCGADIGDDGVCKVCAKKRKDLKDAVANPKVKDAVEKALKESV